MEYSSPNIHWPLGENEFPLVMASPEKQDWAQGVAAYLAALGSPWNRTVVFATSGSSGGGMKGVVFFPEALEASAQGTNEWLGADKGGDWCRPLPGYHVGGFMIHVRAALAGSRVHVYEERWNPFSFARFLASSGAAWSSLVPTQVVDLVREQVKAPSTIRTIVVGGGALDPSLGEEARSLGWPVVQSYGMTESASQIATARLDEPYTGRDIPVLPHWAVNLSPEGRIRIKGAGRFAAYIREDAGAFVLDAVDSGDWWESKDMVSLHEGRLSFLRRADRLVKILGELVDVDEVEHRFNALLPSSLIVPLPDQRRGMNLYACHPSRELLSCSLKEWNKTATGLNKLAGGIPVDIPRNNMGKIDRRGLEEICRQAVLENRFIRE